MVPSRKGVLSNFSGLLLLTFIYLHVSSVHWRTGRILLRLQSAEYHRIDLLSDGAVHQAPDGEIISAKNLPIRDENIL